jgi:hypothetical protein
MLSAGQHADAEHQVMPASINQTHTSVDGVYVGCDLVGCAAQHTCAYEAPLP